MSYIVIKVIKGRRYRYEQRSYRDGHRVRTESRYLGPAEGSFLGPVSPPRRRRKGLLGKIGQFIAANTLTAEEKALIVDEAALLKEVKAEEAAREKARADFEARTGMRLGPPNPTPVEKAPSTIDLSGITARNEPTDDNAGQESPSDDAEGNETAGPSSE